VRAFLAAGLAALVAFLALPMAAWLPAGFVVLAFLCGGTALALAAAAGAGIALLWMLAPAFGLGPALAVVIAVLLPAWFGGTALASTRSLNLVYQALTLGAALLVLAIHALLGDPQGVLMPLIAQLEPLLQQVAATLSQWGIESTPAEIGAATARVAWATLGWMVLLHALMAQFAGLWGLGRLREPGLFGREFRQLKLGRFIAWALAGAFVLSLVAHRLVAGCSCWPPPSWCRRWPWCSACANCRSSASCRWSWRTWPWCWRRWRWWGSDSRTPGSAFVRDSSKGNRPWKSFCCRKSPTSATSATA
jgi:hypothetical protein